MHGLVHGCMACVAWVYGAGGGGAWLGGALWGLGKMPVYTTWLGEVGIGGWWRSRWCRRRGGFKLRDLLETLSLNPALGQGPSLLCDFI